jgi:hypothetical protein
MLGYSFMPNFAIIFPCSLHDLKGRNMELPSPAFKPSPNQCCEGKELQGFLAFHAEFFHA